MKKFDFWLQSFTLLVYIIISPLLFAVIHPTSGDVSLIWIWVVVVAGVAAVISWPVLIGINYLVSPELSFKFKGLIPLTTSTVLAYYIGSGLDQNTEIPFLTGNLLLIMALYFINGLIFNNRLKAFRNNNRT